MNYKPKNKQEKFLVKAFLSLNNGQGTANFLRDLLTEQEIEEFSKRLEIARLLNNGELSYREVAEETQASTYTVSRVALWLKRGCNGYKSVLKKIDK